MTHPFPTEAGHYWAMLNNPRAMPQGEDWVSSKFEVGQVYDNNGTGEDQWRVFVPGIEPSQMIDAFTWGPRVPDYR
jgi:hypothetical protein